jgi:hypothetical protein
MPNMGIQIGALTLEITPTGAITLAAGCPTASFVRVQGINDSEDDTSGDYPRQQAESRV